MQTPQTNALRNRPQRPQRPQGLPQGRPQRPQGMTRPQYGQSNAPKVSQGPRGYTDPTQAPVLMPGGEKRTFQDMQQQQVGEQQAMVDALRKTKKPSHDFGAGISTGSFLSRLRGKAPNELDERMSRMNRSDKQYWNPSPSKREMYNKLRSYDRQKQASSPGVFGGGFTVGGAGNSGGLRSAPTLPAGTGGFKPAAGVVNYGGTPQAPMRNRNPWGQ